MGGKMYFSEYKVGQVVVYLKEDSNEMESGYITAFTPGYISGKYRFPAGYVVQPNLSEASFKYVKASNVIQII